MRREDLVAREQKPHQTLIVVVPCVVLVFCCLPGLPLELPEESPALPDLIEDEDRVESRPREARTNRRMREHGHGGSKDATSDERRGCLKCASPQCRGGRPPSTESIGCVPRMLRSCADLCSGQAPWAKSRQFDFLSADASCRGAVQLGGGIDTLRKASLEDAESSHRRLETQGGLACPCSRLHSAAPSPSSSGSCFAGPPARPASSGPWRMPFPVRRRPARTRSSAERSASTSSSRRSTTTWAGCSGSGRGCFPTTPSPSWPPSTTRTPSSAAVRADSSRPSP